jgi:hypothetical protein
MVEAALILSVLGIALGLTALLSCRVLSKRLHKFDVEDIR